MTSDTDGTSSSPRSGQTDRSEGITVDQVALELKRLVARPLAARHVASYTALPHLPMVQAMLAPDAGPSRIVRAIVEVVAQTIGELDGQIVQLHGLPPTSLDAAALQFAMGELLGITELGQTDASPAPVRRARSATALGYDLPTLGGDKGFREIHEPVLLHILAARLLDEAQAPSWFVKNVQYHYRYDAKRVLASTNYRYEVVSQRDGTDFFINHTAAENLGGFDLVEWTNCEVIERNRLENRTIELHFRLHADVPGSSTHFSYQLKPTDPHMTPDMPRLITIGQIGVASVGYVVDFATPPQKVWSLGAIPPPLAGSPQLEEPNTDDDPRLLDPPYDRIVRLFQRLRVRHFYGVAWKW